MIVLGDTSDVEASGAPFDVGAFLDEVMRPAQVSVVSPSGLPLLGSLLFLWADRRFWFSSFVDSPLVRALERGSQVAVLVDDFSPPVDIRQVRVRGSGTIERHDPARVRRIYERYLSADLDAWPDAFRGRLDDSSYMVWAVTPSSGVVASFDTSKALSSAGRNSKAVRCRRRNSAGRPLVEVTGDVGHLGRTSTTVVAERQSQPSRRRAFNSALQVRTQAAPST